MGSDDRFLEKEGRRPIDLSQCNSFPLSYNSYITKQE